MKTQNKSPQLDRQIWIQLDEEIFEEIYEEVHWKLRVRCWNLSGGYRDLSQLIYKLRELDK